MGDLIKVALFDMAGTTVDDMIQKPGYQSKLPLVISAYDGAFRKAEIAMPFDELNDCRGKDKIEVFRTKVAKYKKDLPAEEQNALAQRLHDEEFVPALLENVPYLREIKGTSEVFSYLKDNGVFVATGSGFPTVVTDAINRQMGWLERKLVDFGTCGQSAGKGRPHPNMINEILVKAGYLPANTDLSKAVNGFDYSIVLKVGDTEEDIREGIGVGAMTIAVSSGTQSISKLAALVPNVVLPSAEAIPLYLGNHGYRFPN